MSGIERTKIGEVGVDSGTLLIGDPCYCFDGDDLDAAVAVAVQALAGPDRALVPDDLEVAVLARENGRRAFRRIEGEALASLLG